MTSSFRSSERPFRFGVLLAGDDAGRLGARARRIEGLGYATAVVSDHAPDRAGPLVALAAVATATTTLRLGTLVLNNDFRHPAVLARDVATLDTLSGGRVELGLGAGWAPDDYRSTGIDMAPIPHRIERLGEAVTVLKGLCRDGELSFGGRHYRVAGGGGLRSAQQPHPPILIGGGGRQLMRMAGAVADIVSVVPAYSTVTGGSRDQVLAEMSPAAFAAKLGWLAEGRAASWTCPELSTLVTDLVISDRPGAATARLRSLYGAGADGLRCSPACLVGSCGEVADRLLEQRAQLGISYVVVRERSAEAFAPVVHALEGR